MAPKKSNAKKLNELSKETNRMIRDREITMPYYTPPRFKNYTEFKNHMKEMEKNNPSEETIALQKKAKNEEQRQRKIARLKKLGIEIDVNEKCGILSCATAIENRERVIILDEAERARYNEEENKRVIERENLLNRLKKHLVGNNDTVKENGVGLPYAEYRAAMYARIMKKAAIRFAESEYKEDENEKKTPVISKKKKESSDRDGLSEDDEVWDPENPDHLLDADDDGNSSLSSVEKEDADKNESIVHQQEEEEEEEEEDEDLELTIIKKKFRPRRHASRRCKRGPFLPVKEDTEDSVTCVTDVDIFNADSNHFAPTNYNINDEAVPLCELPTQINSNHAVKEPLSFCEQMERNLFLFEADTQVNDKTAITSGECSLLSGKDLFLSTQGRKILDGESEQDEEEEELPLMTSKGRRINRILSESEEEGEEEEEENGDAVETETSEEEEEEVKQCEELREFKGFSKTINEFVDDEAELSGSDFGTDDNEDALDNSEYVGMVEELIDDSKTALPSDKKMLKEIQRIHHRLQKDEDDKQLDKLMDKFYHKHDDDDSDSDSQYRPVAKYHWVGLGETPLFRGRLWDEEDRKAAEAEESDEEEEAEINKIPSFGGKNKENECEYISKLPDVEYTVLKQTAIVKNVDDRPKAWHDGKEFKRPDSELLTRRRGSMLNPISGNGPIINDSNRHILEKMLKNEYSESGRVRVPFSHKMACFTTINKPNNNNLKRSQSSSVMTETVKKSKDNKRPPFKSIFDRF